MTGVAWKRRSFAQRIFRISDWRFNVKLMIGPALALIALAFLAWIGVTGIGEQSRTVGTLIHHQSAAARLSSASHDVQAINGAMFRVLALQAAQTPGLDAAAELKKLGGMVDTVNATLRDYRDNYAEPAQRPEVDGLIGDVEKYKGAIDWVSQMLDIDFGSAVSFLKPFEGSFAAMNDRLAAMIDSLATDARSGAQAAAVSAARNRSTFAWTFCGSFALVALIAVAVGPPTARSIRRIAAITLALANGDTGVDTAALRRDDELGAIVESLGVFRDGLLRVRSLQEEQTAASEEAERAKRQALVGMADTIEEQVAKALEWVTSRASSMAMLADDMRASASRTGASAQSAANAAVKARTNVETVAEATEELSRTSREIGAQVTQSTRIASLAVQSGGQTRQAIEALHARIGQISAVADIIRAIAARTNLLALNATIEAARAGEAGRGFAVVAGEVKELATQTARSTEDIGRYIMEVRTATDQSVAAVGRIEETIGQMNDIAGTIAEAVQQQGSATAAIARSVTETAAAAGEMNARIAEVSAEAEHTGAQATEVHGSTAQVAGAVRDLKSAVIRVVRTSSDAVNRRRHPRVAADIGCRISADGGTQDGRIQEISEGGATVSASQQLAPGVRGALQIDGLALRVPFHVKNAVGGRLHLAFDADPEITSGLESFVAALRDAMPENRMSA
jgi:methyl-accepting chemotaxis protein